MTIPNTKPKSDSKLHWIFSWRGKMVVLRFVPHQHIWTPPGLPTIASLKNRIRLQPYIRPIHELIALAMMVIRSHCANQPSGFARCIEPMLVQTFQCAGLTYFHQLRLSCNRWSLNTLNRLKIITLQLQQRDDRLHCVLTTTK